jgi:hypothetical protein
MDKPSINIKNSPFPSQMASDAEKASMEYGLSVGKAIESEWFKRTSGNSCRYYDQAFDFHQLRLYSRGEQSISKYKEGMAIDGDLSYLNLDWSIIPIIPKFVDIVVNGMNDRVYSIKAESQDISSAEKKNLFQETVEQDMVAKDFLMKAKEGFGIDAFNVPPEELPDTPEELSLYMQLKFKPSVEIAEEVAINTIFEMNEYADSIKPAIDYDITTIGIGAAKHTFLPGAGVQIEYVDPANLVYSYTEKADFSDIYYAGDVKQIHYTELKKIDPTITDEKLEEIRRYGSAWYNNFTIISQLQDDPFSSELISVLSFTYKVDKKFVWKKKFLENGGERVIQRDDSFNPPESEEERFERVEAVKDVWYEGVMVLGSSILLKWEMQKNMIRPEAASQKALSNYVISAPRMYKGRIESLVRRMIPFADQIQLTHLKLQQVLSRVVPDGVFLDADGLSEVDLGTGAAYTPQDALKLFFQTGSVVGRSYTGDGEFNNARVPIQELNSSSGSGKMQALIGAYNYQLNMIRDVTGLNEARDASTPNPDALVGIQKMAALNSNTATRHILNAGLSITRRLATCISLRISDILEYADFKDEFAMQVGKYNLAILEDIKNLYLHSFGIFIELEPDVEERAQLEQNIQMSLQQQQIDLEDAIDIRMIKNLKLANEMLKVKRKKTKKALEDREDMKSQIQMQMNMQTQQAASEQKQMTAQIESQSKIALKEAETGFAIQLLAAEVASKKELMQIEFDYNMQLKGIETDNLIKRETKKEDAKDERVNKQATAQSKLIDQRKNNLPPVNFESNEDSLDGFDLSSFNPR